uniref:Uncharacterized protein n=1 Tax=Lepeophtheirus salmonis TaxID=72036 RepID=A0A0K2UPS3_LEPSM
MDNVIAVVLLIALLFSSIPLRLNESARRSNLSFSITRIKKKNVV